MNIKPFYLSPALILAFLIIGILYVFLTSARRMPIHKDHQSMLDTVADQYCDARAMLNDGHNWENPFVTEKRGLK